MAMRRNPASRRAKSTARRTTTRRTHRVARPWTRDEIQFMRKYYKSYETSWIARQLGRTVYSVRYKAVDLSLKKASPSVWKGNRGSNNAFRPTTRRASGMKTRRPSQRRRNQKSFKASSMMQTGRRPRRRMSRRMSK